jgi:hypothetical protein
MAFTIGQKVGTYEILALIGAGGMGQVYRAMDTRLGRQIAIKGSTERFSERFEREARVIASLNHPNICTLHDVGPNFLVMELIEGPTLADRIKDGPIPLEESLHNVGSLDVKPEEQSRQPLLLTNRQAYWVTAQSDGKSFLFIPARGEPDGTGV